VCCGAGERSGHGGVGAILPLPACVCVCVCACVCVSSQERAKLWWKHHRWCVKAMGKYFLQRCLLTLFRHPQPLPSFPTGGLGYRGIRGAVGLGYKCTV
jgi:hypothetical protein